MRMIYVFDQAKKRKALVVGTENKTEHYLGYFTRFGDEASDVEPLRELYKTQVYEVAENLQIPERLRVKAPTAGLWEGQTDEGEFGFTYADADKILSLMIDEKKSREEIIKSFRKENVVEAVLKRVKQNEFKHHLPFLNNNL
jgi:NAD+ synthase